MDRKQIDVTAIDSSEPEYVDGEPITGDGIVQIAYLHGDQVSHSWHDSMRRVMDYDRPPKQLAGERPRAGLNRIAEKPLNLKCGSGVLLASTRNYAVKLFLDNTEHEWMLFVDTDMGFASDAVHKLLASADPVERPMVGALCFAVMTAGYDGMGGWRQAIVPTMYKIGLSDQTGNPSFCFYGPYERNAMVPVAATGAAFLLIHRSVLNLMRDKYGDEWFSQMRDDVGDTVGEDITFCLRARAAGIPIFVNTGVGTTHHKQTWVGEEDYLSVAGLRNTLGDLADLPVAIDLEASFAVLASDEHDHDGMLKFTDDLERYAEIIEATKPDLIIETGTWNGGSARWFAKHGCDVISIDIDSPEPPGAERTAMGSLIEFYRSGSTAPEMLSAVRQAIDERAYLRVMVVLDSAHDGPHVAREIELYGPLVTPGCYLVVEDTIFGYGVSGLIDKHFPAGLDGSPLDAVQEKLINNPDWSRDMAIEGSRPTSCAPAGWWIRNA